METMVRMSIQKIVWEHSSRKLLWEGAFLQEVLYISHTIKWFYSDERDRGVSPNPKQLSKMNKRPYIISTFLCGCLMDIPMFAEWQDVFYGFALNKFLCQPSGCIQITFSHHVLWFLLTWMCSQQEKWPQSCPTGPGWLWVQDSVFWQRTGWRSASHWECWACHLSWSPEWKMSIFMCYNKLQWNDTTWQFWGTPLLGDWFMHKI